MADEENPDPGREFAALMSSAAQAAAPADPEARYGYTTDPVTGERRPKKAAGRPRKPPAIEELKAARAADPGEGTSEGSAGTAGDRPPLPGKRKRGGTTPQADSDSGVPQHRPGLITRGMNKRYRQLGKMVRGLDHDVGQALIAMAQNTSDEPDEDTSVGACWDEVARVNPRVRRFCLSVIQGGAYGALVMAHAPLGVAIMMKFVSDNPGFFGRIIVSMAEPDEDTPEGEGGLPFGLNEQDLAEMMKMAGPLLGKMGNVVPGEVIRDAAEAAAASPQNGHGAQQRRPPAQFARHGQGKRR
jgi:hypothetical protein